MGTSIALVAAPRRQRGTICRASEQFDLSPVFRRARDFCARTYAEWYVISGRPELLSPQQVIGPEDRPLYMQSADERAHWAASLAAELRERARRTSEPPTFVLYASQHYADALVRAAPDLDFELPLARMRFVERLRWYDERLRVRSRVLAS